MLSKNFQTLDEIFSVDQSKKQKTADLFTDNAERQTENYTCYRADVDDPLELPNVIIPSESNAETLFADVSTFHSNYSPLSAYTHIINYELSKTLNLDICKKTKQNICINKKSASVLIGMTIGEALTIAHTQNKGAALQTGYASCKKTLSYTLTRAKILYPNYDLSKVTHHWSRTNEITGNFISSDLNKTITSIIQDLEIGTTKNKPSKKTKQNESPLQLYINGLITNLEFSKHLINTHPSIHTHVQDLAGAFDGRIKALEGIINSILSENTDKESGAQCIAFFCNTILPGSLSHSGILVALSSRYPSILFWYGLFSGASYEFKWQTINNGTGQKLIRDLIKPFSFECRPDSDISYEELEVLSRLTLKATIIKPTHRRSILVSILPGVDIYVDLTTEDGGSRESKEYRDSEYYIKNEKIKALLSGALELLEETPPSKSSRYNSAYKKRNAQ